MAWWHYPDGRPAPAFKGKFDPSHAVPLVWFLLLCLLAWWTR